MTTFTPKRPAPPKIRNVKLEVVPAKYDRLVEVAAENGISLKELLRQLVEFGLDNYQPPVNKPTCRALGRPRKDRT